jgi:hypothetical protein
MKSDKHKQREKTKSDRADDSISVENQNKGHNSKKEALGPNTKR